MRRRRRMSTAGMSPDGSPPTAAANEAAHKLYVDTVVAGAVVRAGDTMAGDLTAPNIHHPVTPKAAQSGTVTLDLSTDGGLTTFSGSGTVTVTSANHLPGRTVTLRVVATAALTVEAAVAGWTWVTPLPSTLTSTRVGILTVTSFGTTAASVVAAWGVAE
jgi:hypothetical protein